MIKEYEMSYGIIVGLLVLLWFRYGWNRDSGMKNGFPVFLRDARGTRSTCQSLGQQFACEVFGEPSSSQWLRRVYAVCAMLSYPFFIIFMLLEVLYSLGFRAMLPYLAASLVVSVVVLSISGFLLLWFSYRNGSILHRVDQFWRRNVKPAAPSPADIQDLPLWWLYGASRMETSFRFFTAAIPMVTGGAALLGIYLACLPLVGESGATPGIIHQILAGLVLIVWILGGWMLPLDGMLKLAAWRGDGFFSQAILDNALYSEGISL